MNPHINTSVESAPRVVQVVENVHLDHGGTVRYALDLAEACAAHSIPTTLLTRDARDVPDSWTDNPLLRVEELPKGPGPFLGKAERTAAAQLIRTADVVHLHCVWRPMSATLASIARQTGRQYVISTHGMLDDWCMDQKSLKKRLYLLMRGTRMYRNSGAMIVSSEGERLQASRWLAGCRVEVIPPILPLDEFDQPAGEEAALLRFGADGSKAIEPGVPTVLFLSRLHYKKGVEHLIAAAELLSKQNLSFRVVLAGTGDAGYENTLREMIRRADLEGVVSLVGLVTGLDKRSLYETADVVVLPSHQENFGLVLTESLASGTPVITTKGVDIWPELEVSGGAVISESDPNSLASAICDLLADDQILTEMGTTGRSWVRETYDPAKVIGRFTELYRSCTQNPTSLQ